MLYEVITPVLEGDLAVQGRGQAEDDRALDLAPDDDRVDRLAAVDRAHDAVHLHRAVGADRDLGDFRDIAAERLRHGDAAMHAGGRRPAPARLLRRELESYNFV